MKNSPSYYEKERLSQEGKPDLADKVEWTSKDIGDGIGYDIRSFETNDAVRYIEVKTTKSGKEYSFFLSRHELEFSEKHPDEFCVYRVFNYGKDPKLYMLKGALDECCDLAYKILGRAKLRPRLSPWDSAFFKHADDRLGNLVQGVCAHF